MQCLNNSDKKKNTHNQNLDKQLTSIELRDNGNVQLSDTAPPLYEVSQHIIIFYYTFRAMHITRTMRSDYYWYNIPYYTI